jgi:hypothetical protein
MKLCAQLHRAAAGLCTRARGSGPRDTYRYLELTRTCLPRSEATRRDDPRPDADFRLATRLRLGV